MEESRIIEEEKTRMRMFWWFMAGGFEILSMLCMYLCGRMHERFIWNRQIERNFERLNPWYGKKDADEEDRWNDSCGGNDDLQR